MKYYFQRQQHWLMPIFSITYKCRMIVFLGLILHIACSCKPDNELPSTTVAEFHAIIGSVTNSEFVLETGVAHEVLVQLYEQGRLPGAFKESGELSCDLPQMIVSNKVIEMTYPALRTFRLTKLGENATNIYILEKESSNSVWQLKRAWKADSEGQVINEWPVK
jgi:hypothetical protein